MINALSSNLFLVIGIAKPESGAVKKAKGGRHAQDGLSDKDKAGELTNRDVSSTAGDKGSSSAIGEKEPCKSRSTSQLLVAYLGGDAQREWRGRRSRDLVTWAIT